MDRSDKGHMEEKLNLRSFYLRLLGKIWIIPVAALLGALLAGGIYTLVTVTFGPVRTYKGEARLYISFAYDENKGTLVDYYNGYTWNNMLVPTDDILNPIISELESQQIFLSKDELLSSINADIPSDVRIMLLSAENKDKDLADAILLASVKSMESYGANNSAFDSIKTLSIDKARLVTYTDRSFAAICFGALAGAVIMLLVELFADALDDAIYVPEDIRKRYGIDSLGILFGKGSTGSHKESDEIYKNELIAACKDRFGGKTEVVVISTDSINGEDNSVIDCGTLQTILGIKGKNDKESAADSYVDSIDISRQWPRLVPMSVPGKVLDNYRKIGTCDGVILCVPYGVKNGAMTEHVIAQLRKHDCPVLGIVLARANKKFIDRYYGYGK